MEKSISVATSPLQDDENFMENFKESLEENGFNIEFSELIDVNYDIVNIKQLRHT